MGNLTVTPVFDDGTNHGFGNAPIGSRWADNPDVAAWTAVVNQLCSDLQNYLDTPNVCTLKLQFGWGYFGSTPVAGGAIAQSGPNGASAITYSALRTLLLGQPSNNSLRDGAYASANIPSSDPSGFGVNWGVYGAQQFALGMSSGTMFAGCIGFGSVSFDTTSDGSSCAVGKYSLYTAGLHEARECFGGVAGNLVNAVNLQDLFAYSAPGVRNFSSSGTRYASADDGNTVLGTYNQAGSLDFGDFNNAFNSAYNAQGNTGQVSILDPLAIKMLTLIGFPLTANGRTAAGLSSGAISGSRYIDTDTFFTSFIAPGVVGIDGALFGDVDSFFSATISLPVPANITPPQITGTQRVAHTLTVVPGTWTNSPTSRAYQWKSNGVSVGIGTTYAQTESDKGHAITVDEIASNASGDSLPSTSDSTGPVAGPSIFTF